MMSTSRIDGECAQVKIAVCGSLTFAECLAEWARRLEEMGHAVYLPEPTETTPRELTPEAVARRKIDGDLIRKHWAKIAESEAILVVNVDKDGVPNYIGGNTFLEMGFAHVLGKTIYVLNPIPKMPYSAEMLAMQPVILDGDFDQLQPRLSSKQARQQYQEEDA